MTKSLQELGIKNKDINEHKIKTGRMNIYECIKLICLRKQLEDKLNNKTNSGRHRLKIFRRIQRKYQKKYPPDKV